VAMRLSCPARSERRRWEREDWALTIGGEPWVVSTDSFSQNCDEIWRAKPNFSNFEKTEKNEESFLILFYMSPKCAYKGHAARLFTCKRAELYVLTSRFTLRNNGTNLRGRARPVETCRQDTRSNVNQSYCATSTSTS
jgi:hypothetical protein